MSVQNYNNHVRLYPPHHFIYYPIVLILTGFAIYKAYHQPVERIMWLGLAAVFLILAWLSFMMRQHYALLLQNRLVRLEMRHKYFVLSGKDFEPLEKQLSFEQIAALRFASDDELLALVQKAVSENLKPDQIKKMIVQWKPDMMRV